MNKKVLVVSLFSLIAFPICLVSFSSNNYHTSLATNHNDNCVWNHYEELAPTLNDNGLRSYYVCCLHHQYQFEVPTIGIINPTKGSSYNFSNSLDDNDSRVILSYNKQINNISRKIHDLYIKNNIEFNDYLSILDIKNSHINIPEEYHNLITNYDEFLYINNVFNKQYSKIISSTSLTFNNREYSSKYDVSVTNDSLLGNVSDINNISGNDTFWIYPSLDIDISKYNQIYFYIRSSGNYNLDYRNKLNYSYSKRFSISNEWSLISIDITSLNKLSDLGLAIWFGKEFNIDNLYISDIFGSYKENIQDNILFDASKGDLVYNDYICDFTSSRGNDEDIGNIYQLDNMSTNKDWLWFKPNLSLSLNSYSAIYFYMKTSVDTTIELRETYTGRATLIKKINFVKDIYQTVIIEVNNTNFPNLNINNLGIGKYSDSGHTVTSSGTWYISDIYGINKEYVDGYELVDNIYVPRYVKENDFDITAYATPKISSDNADQVIKDVKDAYFTQIIPLYNGRNGTLENEFITNLKSYNSAIISSNKEKYKQATFNSISSFMNSIKDNNKLMLETCNKYGINYIDFISLIYDFDSLADSNNVTIKDNIYEEVMTEILSYIDYSDNKYYKGLFLKDEPGVKNDFSLYKTFIELYKNNPNLKGTPFINLLPFGDGANSKNFNNYLDNYFSNIYPLVDYVSFDQYPMKINKEIINNHLYCLSLYAERLLSTNGDLSTFIHSTISDDNTYDIAGITSYRDLLFQMYSNMLFGANNINYFVYSSNSGNNGLVSYNGLEKNSLYDISVTANKIIRSFSDYYRYFSFNGVKTFGEASQFNNLKCVIDNFNKINISNHSGNFVVSEFKNNADNGYLIMNYSNPQINNTTSDINISFNNDINYVLIFENGEKHVKKVDDNMKLSIPGGKAIFIIPLNL